MILNGKMLADKICRKIADETIQMKKKPKLAVILAGNNPASLIYVKNKQKKAELAGIETVLIKLPANVSEDELLKNIDNLNKDDEINAVLIQLPLPEHINAQRAIEAVNPLKDADGFTSYNFGAMALGYKPYVFPCTPNGVINLLEYYNINLSGAHAAVIGRSNISGKPLALMLLQKNASVTVLHSMSKNIKEITKTADIVVSAAGREKLITADYIKNGAVLIDIGINRTQSGIAGDIDFEGCFNKASYITPVPGGIGPMTIAMLMKNTLDLYKLNNKN